MPPNGMGRLDPSHDPSPRSLDAHLPCIHVQAHPKPCRLFQRIPDTTVNPGGAQTLHPITHHEPVVLLRPRGVIAHVANCCSRAKAAALRRFSS